MVLEGTIVEKVEGSEWKVVIRSGSDLAQADKVDEVEWKIIARRDHWEGQLRRHLRVVTKLMIKGGQ